MAVHQWLAIRLQVSHLVAIHKAHLVHQVTHGNNNLNPATHNHNNRRRLAKVAAGRTNDTVYFFTKFFREFSLNIY